MFEFKQESVNQFLLLTKVSEIHKSKEDRKKVLIPMDKLISMEEADRGINYVTLIDGSTFAVKEKPQDIMKAIQELGKSKQ